MNRRDGGRTFHKGKESDAVWSMTCWKLKKQLPDSAIQEWLDCFQLSELTQKKAVITFKGKDSAKPFQNEYGEVFRECLRWASGYEELETEFQPAKEEIQKSTGKSGTKKEGSRRKRGKVLCKLVAAALLIGLFVSGITISSNVNQNKNFKETFYQVASGKTTEGLRIVQLSDLHNSQYGENNEELVMRIADLQPDLIVMTGDMVDRREESADIAVELCRSVSEIAPTYYIYGNNETEKAFHMENMMLASVDELLGCTEDDRDPAKFYELDDDLRVMLESAGVRVLLNECETVRVGSTTVDILGVVTSSPGAFWEYTGDLYSDFVTKNTDHLKLFLCHEPTLFEVYDSEQWGDLNLCGHTHGGVADLPYFGRLYISSKGERVFFPEKQKDEDYYVAGMYEVSGNPLIVNTGLTNRGVVRINNQPELVVIDVNRY